MASSKKLLTPAKVAEMLNVSPITVRYWAKEGRLNFITTPGGHRRFQYNDVVKLMSGEAELNQKDCIVIVEDDVQHAELLVEYINVLFPSIVVKVASTGYEAGSMIQCYQPCLVFLDIVMPDIDGFAVCQHIRSNQVTSNIPVIAMSGCSDQNTIDNILLAGAETFLVKPIRLSMLKKAIEDALDS